MKRSNFLYIIYFLIIIGITFFLTIKIANREINFNTFLGLKSVNEDKFLNDEECVLNFVSSMSSVKNYRKVNSYGLSDYNYSYYKPKGVFRIIALGDSMTFGHGVDIDESWPKQLEKKLNQLNTSREFEVLNFGKVGANTKEELDLFKKEGIKYNPDLIILQIYPDDWFNEKCRNERKIKLLDNISWSPKIQVYLNSSSEDELNKFLDTLCFIQYFENLDENEKKNEIDRNFLNPLFKLAKIANEKNISMVIVAWDFQPFPNILLSKVPCIQKAMKNYFNNGDYIFEKISKIPNIKFLDLSQYLPYSEEIRLKDAHLNKRGYEIVSDRIMEFLKSGVVIPN